MPRRRVAVALLPPSAISEQIQGLRALLRDPRIADLPPHLTLIPPVNLQNDDLQDLQEALRLTASQTAPFALGLGPVASFTPATPTLHLSVTGQVEALLSFRDQLRVGPVNRPDTWPFTPHVTLRDSVPPELIDPAIDLFTGELPTWEVDCVYLLERVRTDSFAAWVPILQEPFATPVVVGRGGIELRLRTLTLLEPQVEQLLRQSSSSSPTEVRVQQGLLVVVAELLELPGQPVAAAVGVLSGPSAQLQQLVVSPETRKLGIGRQTLMHWCAQAASRNAAIAVTSSTVETQVLLQWGFEIVGRSMVRRLLIDSAE